ncbi:hypothetical protein ACKC9G_00375 [Pokkaliibacter sp. CJK22405]|uniref:hypothetical protein n=1 Tax=Pokkaliibacter sp. CJK22405 TaxID=3384615 RepID=UPI003984931A
MSILNNALDSIAIGLEDFESTDDRRIISATRNIFSGILLLFKAKLCEISPQGSDEALIKQKILPETDEAGVIKWIGRGKKTVDVQNIKERFESLKISVDWKRLDNINKYRNDIEHYHSTLKRDAVKKMISDSFIIIRDFIVDELNKDPKSLLGDKSWKILVEVNEVYLKEKQKCDLTLEQLSYYTDEIFHALREYNCSECGSDLLEFDDARCVFKCRACENELQYDEIVNDAVNEYYAGATYLALKDGGDIPVVDCPLCGIGVYIVHEGVCVSCGGSANHQCAGCGSNIPAEELSDSIFCGYCNYKIDKVMSE